MALSEAYDNKKIRRLGRSLGIKPYAALGIMEVVWNWARKSARTGRIEPEQWDEIVDRLGWESPATSFRAALVAEKLIDPMPGGWDWIHDWHEYADNTTRRYLEQRGMSFANGAPARFAKVEHNGRKVEQNYDFADAHTRARPEPEPEPEPEPAAATRARPREPSPPPQTRRPDTDSGSGRLTAIAELLHRYTPDQPAPPDTALVAQVAAALGAVPVAAFSDWLSKRARAGGTKPRRYGFWLSATASFSATWRAAPPDPPPKPAPDSAPLCQTCLGNGRVLAMPAAEQASLDQSRSIGKLTEAAYRAAMESSTKPCPTCQPARKEKGL